MFDDSVMMMRFIFVMVWQFFRLNPAEMNRWRKTRRLLIRSDHCEPQVKPSLNMPDADVKTEGPRGWLSLAISRNSGRSFHRDPVA